MEKLNFVVFGITSNLAQIKLVPALYDLWSKQAVHQIKITGLSYRERPVAEIKKLILADVVAKHPQELDKIDEFFGLFEFITGDFGDENFYGYLRKNLEKESDSNLIYFLATHPDYYKSIFSGLNKFCLNKKENGWVRLMIEKPLGNDLESGIELNQLLGQYFDENQIFRIDHYLGKETIQNILAFRFNNDFVENGLTYETVDHIQATISDPDGVEDRIGFYDNSGALRDVGQSHLLQMLAISLMDQPKDFGNDAVTDARVKVFENLEPEPQSLVLGQYDGYPVDGSRANTYFAFRTTLKTGKFAGVPIYARGGKRMTKDWTEIAFVLKNNSDVKNILIYRITPNEGIILTVGVKKPGYKMEMQEGAMQFCFRNITQNIINPYEKLILDVIHGDPTFFNDAIEVEKQWQFIDGLQAKEAPLFGYQQGTWGPKEAEELIRKDGREWLEPSEEYCRF